MWPVCLQLQLRKSSLLGEHPCNWDIKRKLGHSARPINEHDTMPSGQLSRILRNKIDSTGAIISKGYRGAWLGSVFKGHGGLTLNPKP